MRNSEFLALGVAALTITLLMKLRHKRRAPAALSRGRTQDYVRAAGPREMADPPRKWNIVDETVDESFPASDPPRLTECGRTEKTPRERLGPRRFHDVQPNCGRAVLEVNRLSSPPSGGFAS